MNTMVKPAENGTFEIIDVEENEQDSGLMSVLGELGVESMEDIMLKVYRTNEMGKDAHCFDTIPEAINGIEDRLRDSYGKGDYKIKVFAPTPTGGKSVKKVVKLSIETPLEKDVPEVDNSKDDLATVMTSLMSAQQTAQSNMMQMFKESQLESQNRMQEMMITILSNKNDGEKQPSLLETMSLLKTLQPEQKDPLESIIAVMNITDKMKESATPEEPSALGELSKAASSLVELAVNAPKQPAPATPAQPGTKPDTQPATTAGQPSPQIEGNTNDMNPLIKMKLKPQLLFLLEKARQGKNVAVYADLMIEEIPEQFYPQLVQALGADDDEALATLMSIEPTVVEQADWFKALCGEIRAAFAEAAEEIPDDTAGQDLTTGNGSGDDTENTAEKTDTNADKEPANLPAD